MECPKCRHKIYINLTPEELVYCPYCNQRMIPPEESNICSACGKELPLGSVYCLSCGKKLTPEEEPVIEQHAAPPARHSREDIAGLVTQEPAAFHKPEPALAPYDGSTQPPTREETTAENPAAGPVPEQIREVIPSWQIKEEAPAAQSRPETPATPPSMSTTPQPEEKEASTFHIPDQHIAQPGSVIELPAKGEPASAQQPPEPQAMPATETIPLHYVEEATPPGYKQPQTRPASSREEIGQTVQEESPVISQEPSEARATLRGEDAFPADEFIFCFACGQKLPSGSLYCPRCGKNIKVSGFSGTSEGSPQPNVSYRREDVIAQDNKEPPVINNPPVPGAPPSAAGIQPKTFEEPPPVPIRYVQPKYQPVPSRESITKAMEDRAPAMQPFPKAKATSGAPLKPVWNKIRDWSSRAIAPVRDFFSGQWRLRRLYGKWAKESDIAPEDIPSTAELKQITKEGKAPAYQPVRMVYLILGAIVFVAFFIFIGVIMSRCS